MSARRKFVGTIRLPEALRAVKAERRRRGKRVSEHTTHEQSAAALRRQNAKSNGRYTPPARSRGQR